MDNNYNFSEFSRQSSKGILVIYGRQLIQLFKVSWILVFLFITKFSEFSEKDLISIFIGFAVLLSILFIISYLIYRNFQFKIEGNYFILKNGVLSKKSTSVSFDRIQNINFKQNIIQQFINVYGVSIETAGSKKTEIYIKALSHEKAKALKEKLSSGTVASEIISENKAKPLLKIGVKQLLKVSLTENHLQSLLLFLALMIGLFQQLEQVLDSIGQKEFLKEYVSESSDAVFGSIVLIVVLLFLLTIVALISSFVRVFLFHFDLTLFLKEDAFEINQGLMTKKSIILKRQKVQSIIVSTNPLKRIIGLSYITFKQAVSGKATKKNKEKLIRIVGCEAEKVQIVKSTLFTAKNLEDREKEFSDRYYKIRMLFQSFLLLVILNTLLYVVFQDLQTLYVNLGLMPLFYFLVHKKFKKRFFKITGNMLLVGKGLIETHHTYFELFKVQNVKMNQTIFQQRRDVVDLVLQTASGKIRIPCIATEKATEIYNYILYKVETSKEPWM